MKFLASYFYAGKKWGLTIDAENWHDAEKRCQQLNLNLDGELILTIPAIPVIGSLVIKSFCRVRNMIRDYRMYAAVKGLIS